VEIQEIITFRMNYGPNDNEISRLFRGLIDPTLVKYDPVEIEQVLYSTLDELIKKMELSEDEFCRWFIQIIKWSIGKPSELKVLHVPDNIRLPWLSIK
jgi:isopentenyldiphosphate isomerase